MGKGNAIEPGITFIYASSDCVVVSPLPHPYLGTSQQTIHTRRSVLLLDGDRDAGEGDASAREEELVDVDDAVDTVSVHLSHPAYQLARYYPHTAGVSVAIPMRYSYSRATSSPNGDIKSPQ